MTSEDVSKQRPVSMDSVVRRADAFIDAVLEMSRHESITLPDIAVIDVVPDLDSIIIDIAPMFIEPANEYSMESSDAVVKVPNLEDDDLPELIAICVDDPAPNPGHLVKPARPQSVRHIAIATRCFIITVFLTSLAFAVWIVYLRCFRNSHASF